MLNARIEIDTKTTPYRVRRGERRGQPSLLDPYFKDKNDWMIFCDRIDLLLDGRGGLEEIKATWMLLGVVTTILLLGMVVGIICTFMLVDRTEDSGLLLGCLFGGTFMIFAIYLYLMQMLVVDQLHAFARKVDEYCAELAKKKAQNAVQFRFQRNGNKCTLFFDRDFQVWIDVSTLDPVDLGNRDGDVELTTTSGMTKGA